MKNEKVMFYKVAHKTLYSAPDEPPQIVEVPATKSVFFYNFKASLETGYVSRIYPDQLKSFGFGFSRLEAMEIYKTGIQEKMNYYLKELARLQKRLESFEAFEKEIPHE